MKSCTSCLKNIKDDTTVCPLCEAVQPDAVTVVKVSELNTLKKRSRVAYRVGMVLLILGSLNMVAAFVFIKTSVTTDDGREVANLSLMDERQCVMMMGAVMAIIGAIFANGSRSSYPDPKG